jgi:hypothetical protein
MSAAKRKSDAQRRRDRRAKTKKDRLDTLTTCGAKVHKCVQSKKKSCRRRSRELLAKKMGMTRKDLSKLYPNFDVHHEKRMTFKQAPGCSCSLSCPINQTSLVPSSWNRGVMKEWETNTQKGYSFDEQMKGVRKSKGKGRPPKPPSSLSVAHPKGTCRSRLFLDEIDKRVEGRAFTRYEEVARSHKSIQARSRSWFGEAIKAGGTAHHTVPELRTMQMKGGSLHRLLPRSPPKKPDVKRAKLQPLVVLRHAKAGCHLLDGKARLRTAHKACPSRANVAVLFVDA